MTKRDLLALTFILLMVGTMLWMSFTVTWSYNAIVYNTGRIDVIEELYKRSDDRWRKMDQKEWAKELVRLNPNLVLPEIKP